MILENFFKPRLLNDEKYEIMQAMEDIRNDLESVHHRFNYVTDEMIIDSLIYEIKSLQKKYAFYLKLCKEKGFVAEGFDKLLIPFDKIS